MKRAPLIAGLMSLAGCSGEKFDVAACLDPAGELSFELGTVRGWFGLRKTPSYANVGVEELREPSPLWWAHPNGRTKRFVRYGIEYEGWSTDTKPGRLVVGKTYLAEFSGFNSGYARFVYDARLPRCSRASAA